MTDRDLERAIWEWLPARRDSRRVTDAAIIAANLHVDPATVATVLDRLVADHRVERYSRRGRTGHYRGHWPRLTAPPAPGLWETP